MGNMYETYNLKEIRRIINQAVELEKWTQGINKKDWEIIQNLKVCLFDMLGIED